MATDDIIPTTNLPALLRNRPSLDQVEAFLLKAGGKVQQFGEVLKDLPVTHHFTPGLYCREILMPAGSVLTSKVHNTEHPFVVSQGSCSVYNEETGESVLITAPHFGITLPGTRRLLFIHEDTIWTTFHPTNLTDVEEIERTIIKPHFNPLLPQGSHTSERRLLK